MTSFLTSNFFRQTVWGMVRHGLTSFGTLMIADGYMTNSDMNGLIGSGFFLFGIGWSVYNKKMQEKK